MSLDPHLSYLKGFYGREKQGSYERHHFRKPFRFEFVPVRWWRPTDEIEPGFTDRGERGRRPPGDKAGV